MSNPLIAEELLMIIATRSCVLFRIFVSTGGIEGHDIAPSGAMHMRPEGLAWAWFVRTGAMNRLERMRI